MIALVHKSFAYVAPKLGASPDEVKFVFSMLLSYPLAGLLKRVPDAKPHQKNIFSIIASIFYLIVLFDLWSGTLTLVISAGGAYCIAKYLRSSPYMPWIGFGFVMGHMSINHIWRQIANNAPSTVDVTGAQMVMLMKLSAFCWNVADGHLPDDQLSEFQRDRALKELPSVLDFAGYVFFFPALMSGPAFDYAEYRRWIDTTMFDLPAQVDPSKKPPVRKKRRIPRSGTPAMLKAASGLAWVLLYIFLSGPYSHELLLSDSYTQYGFLRRIWILYLTNLVARFKYYGAWSLTEGACILAGLGYNGVDAVTGKVSWNRLENINPWQVETAQNPRGYLAGWNINTNNWLRNYVYLRVTPRGKKPGFRASLITFGTSALWHGFYPGYYLTFVLASFIQTAAKNFRRHVRPFFLDPIKGNPRPTKVYYDIVTYFGTQLTFAFCTTPFLMLSLKDSLQVWGRVYFYALIWTLVSMGVFASPAKAMLHKQLEKRHGKASARLVRTISTDSMTGGQPILGISKDPEGDVTEAIEEIKTEIERKRNEELGAKKNE